MGCLKDTIPPDCQKFIDDVHGFLSTSNDLLMGIPFHYFFRTRKWDKLTQNFIGVYSHAMGLIKAKIEEIEKEAMNKVEEEEDEGTDLDFLTHMINSKKMKIEEVAVNAVDLLGAGVDTVSTKIQILCSPLSEPYIFVPLLHLDQHNYGLLFVPTGPKPGGAGEVEEGSAGSGWGGV